jgi:ABC-2 type transport system ATP-binding protein
MSLDQSQNILSIKGVSVSYGKLQALKDVSLDIRAGETFGLIGLNGAGKTSMIKAILGLRPANEGEVSIFGRPPADKKARERLAFLPERFEPAWFLTGMEFLRFSLELYGRAFDKDEILARAQSVALDAGALNRRVQTYSKGMRQKLGLIGTVLTGCDLMILDEPMSGLDPLARTLVKDMIMGCKAKGQTVFLSSHILADLDEICDRVAVIHEGILRFTGTPAELKRLTGSENLERSFLHFISLKQAA